MARSRKKVVPVPAELPVAEKPVETVRIRGKAESLGERDGDILVTEIECALEGSKVGKPHRFGRAFRVRLGDGSAVEVYVLESGTTLVPNEKTNKRWSKLEGTALAKPFASIAPGPDVFATIEGFVLREGDDVEVFGEVSASAFVEHTEGLREAPETRVSAVRAKIVAAGRNARSDLDAAHRKLYPPAERIARNPRIASRRLWATIMGGFSVALSVTLLAWAFVDGLVGLELEAIVTSATTLATFCYAFADDEAIHFVPGGAATTTRLVTPSHLRVVLSYSLAGMVMLIGVASMFADSATRATTSARAFVWMGVVATVGLAIAHLVAGREKRRDVALLLDSPPFPDNVPNGAWGSASGRVRDLTPVRSGKEIVAMSRDHDVTTVTGSDPDIVKTSLNNDGTFLVESDRAVFEVFPEGALWATTERDVVKKPEGFHEREIVPVDARIVVAGRITRGNDGGAPRLRPSQGPRSLVFFATHAGADPVARLRRYRRVHWITFAILVGAIAAVTASTVAYWPVLPPERESSD